MIENQHNALNHVDLSGMMLKFDACSKIIRAVSNSKSLCALHLSRNGLHKEQKRLLVRQIGIPESDLDGNAAEQNDIVNEIFHETIKADQEHQHPKATLKTPLESERLNDGEKSPEKMKAKPVETQVNEFWKRARYPVH